VFTHVPAGKHRVARRHNNPHGQGALGMSHFAFVDVKAGETSEVVIGGKGAVVTGKFVAVPHDAKVDWTLTVQRLAPPEDSPNMLPTSRAYEFFCQSDGSFTVPDVASGLYKLRARVTAGRKGDDDINYSPGMGKEIGTAEREVTVSEPTEEEPRATVDLGQIEVPLTP